MSPEAAQTNEEILAEIEASGGGYVWEPEVFSVALMDVAFEDSQVTRLCGLTGVKQIALNASRLSFDVLQRIARIPGLQSLVLSGVDLAAEQQSLLERFGSEVEIVSDEA
jgi:hypothetical protein